MGITDIIVSQDFISNILAGFTHLTWQSIVMLFIGGILLYLGVAKDYEPLLLIPIGFGCILANLPLTELIHVPREGYVFHDSVRDILANAGLLNLQEGVRLVDEGILDVLYNAGIGNELFPCLLFIGIGAMTDFGPLLQNPRILLLGGAGQFGIFLALLLALALGYDKLEAVCISIIGACDGPTSIYMTSKFNPALLGPISVAAYSYMSLVPIIQPPIMKLVTSKKEREMTMSYDELKPVTQTTKTLFPVVVTIITLLIAPTGAPLMGTLMLGNFLRESKVVGKLVKSAENEIASVSTLFLGLTVGSTMNGDVFLTLKTLGILLLGFIAICGDTAFGVFGAKIMNIFSKVKINPLIGAAGISAFPMSARVVHKVGTEANPHTYLLMHAMGVNTGGQIGSVLAASVMIAVITALQGMGIVL
ncbi:MAG: sodium ion-translocating decarboxylase subunit beta [Desulfitobacteriaceae bacterium]|nr:sodium ion-translocating decarboxylase subunit beta [Desulfitobacteriaceae bacterium]MDD4347152.1 sodium ion-translocating decarboxylase subunit beta [Desulfitobacteriaceae bacterium]MDD4401564.1 sodium ion-translocating decarboxylase subunit beta [Desulfitobacteriaceae bacterium]